LTGYWSDIIFTVGLFIVALIIAFKCKTQNKWLTISVSTIIISLSIFAIAYFGRFLNSFTLSEISKLKSFNRQEVDNRIFHAYFKPVGSYGRGYGSFWITESSKYFPIIERTVYYKNATNYDFNLDSFEETPIKEVIKNYIEQDVIKKQ